LLAENKDDFREEMNRIKELELQAKREFDDREEELI
jgi:hypothetical protein